MSMTESHAKETLSKFISVTEKRLITIPKQFYDMAGIDGQVECIYQDGDIILRPVKKDTLAKDILQELVAKGLAGDELVKEFDKLYSETKSAIDNAADKAKEISKSDEHKDDMNEVFGDL